MRESRHRRDRISDKNSQKRINKHFGSLRFFFKSGPRIPFSVGNFHFFGRGKTIFLGGGYNFKTGWAVTIRGHIQACPTRFLAQKTFVISKRGGQVMTNDSLLGRPACNIININILYLLLLHTIRMQQRPLKSTSRLKARNCLQPTCIGRRMLSLLNQGVRLNTQLVYTRIRLWKNILQK